MLKQTKKKLTKAVMKLMMNERVGKTVMAAFQKKNELNEKLSRVYSAVQLPSLADHETVSFALDRLKRRIKTLEREVIRAEKALDNIEPAPEQPKAKTQKPPRKSAPKPIAKRAVGKPKAKKSAGKRKAPKRAAPKTIAPLGAADAKPTNKGGLLDIDLRKPKRAK